MIPVDLKQFADDVAGKLLCGDGATVVNAVVTDSRADCSGAVFVPLSGENFDGHDYVAGAVENGAAAFLWAKDTAPPKVKDGVAVIKAIDTQKAYQAAGHANRERSSAVVIGLTGSSGKTTTKGILANLLSAFRTVSTEKNYNNEIGVPKTLLKIDALTEYAVVEMGMRARNEISELAKIARPDYGLITNVGLTHVGRLGSEKEIALAKGELLEFVSPNGKVFLNADNAWTTMLARMSPAEVVTFGMDAGDVRCSDAGYTAEGVFFTVVTGESGGEFEVSVPVPGKAGVYNALSAVAVGLALGMSRADISERLAMPVVEEGRMAKYSTGDGKLILDDSYNANPASVKMAMDLLGRISWEGRRVAVLGDMLELGDLSEEEHRRVGRECAKFVDVILTIGPDAKHIASGAGESGNIEKKIIKSFETFEDFEPGAEKLFQAGDLVLVKGSRGMKMERIVDLLKGDK